MSTSMASRFVWWCFFLALASSTFVKGEMENKCVVEGTVVEFHCPGADSWYVGRELVNDGIPPVDILTINASASDGAEEKVIYCFFVDNDYPITARLLTLVSSDSQLPLINVTVDPLDKYSLLLQWDDLFVTGNTTYTVVLTVGQDQKTMNTSEPSVLLELEGSECQPFNVSISLPGNCRPATVTGTFLVDPPYPKPEAFSAEVLENKTVILTWVQPEDIFDEQNLTYIIMALVSDQQPSEERVLTLAHSDSPREEFNMTQVEDCSEVMFTLIQLGDCREQQLITAIPIFPRSFLSELKAEILFSDTGELGRVKLNFQPPDLCEFQLEGGRYLLTVSNRSGNWSVGPFGLKRNVIFSDNGTLFARDSRYKVTAAVFTQQGTVSSTTTFNTTSPLAEAKLDEKTLVVDISAESVSVEITWGNPTNTLSNTFPYEVRAVLVETGETVGEEIVVVSKDTKPVLELNLDQYACEKVNITVTIFNTAESVYKITTLPARPQRFQRNVTADTFMLNGEIKELEVSFTPPKLCDFQRASYVMTFSSVIEEWSTEPVEVDDTDTMVKVDLETGFELDRNYSLTVTVMIVGYGNLTSSAYFMFRHLLPLENERQSSWLSVEQGAIIGGTFLVGVVSLSLTVVVGMYVILFHRKRSAAGEVKFQPTVVNPIYESGDDSVYEELPDFLPTGKGDTVYSDVGPPLPSPRYDHLPPVAGDKLGTEKEGNVVSQTPTPQCDPTEKLTIPSSRSSGALSVHSTAEDCYTVMNRAGTLTVVPRSRHSAQWGASPTRQ